MFISSTRRIDTPKLSKAVSKLSSHHGFVSILARKLFQLESASPEDKHCQLCIICLKKRDDTVEKAMEFIKWDNFISLN